MLAVLCGAAFSARAQEKTEILTNLQVEQAYDSNIFLTDKDEKGSAVTFFRPSLTFDDTGTLGWTRLYGYMNEHIYWSESKLTGIDRGFGGDISRRILPLTTIFANGSYQRLAAHLEVRAADVVTTSGGSAGVPGESVIQPGQLLEGATPDIDLGQGTFGVKQQLTPRTSATLSGGPFSVDYLEDGPGLNQWRDRWGWYATMAFDHVLTPLDHLTLDLSAFGTNFSDAFSGPVPVDEPGDFHTVQINTGKTISQQQSLTIGWTRSWSELWSTTLAVGGRRLHTSTNDALRPLSRIAPSGNPAQPIVRFTDFVPESFSDTGPGVVGEFSVQRTMARGSAALSYSRETRTTSSLFASNVNVDTVALVWIQRLAPRWQLTLRGSYEHYESVNDNAQFLPAAYVEGSFNPITGPEYVCGAGSLVTTGTGINTTGQCQTSNRSSLHSDYWTGLARIDWQLYRRLSTFATLRYQDRNGDELLFGQDYNRFFVSIGFRYDYALGF